MASSSKKNHLRITKPHVSTNDSREDSRDWGDFYFPLEKINFGNQEQYNLIGANRRNKDDLSNLKRDLSKSIGQRVSMPFINIKEFEPKLIFKWTQHLKLIESTIKNLGTSLKGIASKIKDFDQQVDNFLNDWSGRDVPPKKTNTTDATSSMGASFFIDDENFENQIITRPIKMYRSFFNGRYIRNFDIPFFGNTYMTVDGDNGWNTTDDLGFSKELKGFLGMLWNTVKNLNIIDMPELPLWEWKPDGTDEFYNISTEFHLINNNRDNTRSNFWYLLNLIQGPFWVQYGTRALPPNIYSVDIPGITYLQFAKMHVTVDTVGNKRIIPNLATEMGGSFGKYGIYDRRLAERLDNMENVFFPDAWKVKIELISMVPNNFNVYVNYLLNGNPDNIYVGSSINTGIFKPDGKDLNQGD